MRKSITACGGLTEGSLIGFATGPSEGFIWFGVSSSSGSLKVGGSLYK